MMRALRDLTERIRYFFDAGRAEDLREEMEGHIAMEAEANERAGMGPDEVLRAARLKFGSGDRFAEETRDASGVGGLLDFIQDVRHAVRGVTKARGFTAVAVLTLAVGIGVASTVFTIADHLLYRPVPGVIEPHDLAYVRYAETDQYNYTHMSYANLLDVTPNVPAFTSMMAYVGMSLQADLGKDAAAALQGEAVVGHYFGTLGVTAQRGRLFSPEELAGSTDPRVAVISDRLWRETLRGGDVIGRRIRLNAETFTIIGIVRRGYEGPSRLDNTEVWVPGVLYPVLRHMDPARMTLMDRDANFFRETVGRLAPGATPALARQQLASVMRRLIEEHPEGNEQYTNGPVGVYRGLELPPGYRDRIDGMVKLLMLVGGLLLVVAWANVANLLLFRAMHTRGESAVRRALGASGLRLLQHYVAQGAVLGVLAAAAGVLVTILIMRILGDTGLPGIGSIEAMSIDGRVMTFALLLALATSIAFAAVPTLLARRLDLVHNLRESARTETGRLVWLRRTLVVTQVALAAALVVPGILLANSVRNLSRVDLGFDIDRLMLFGVGTEEQGYDEDDVQRFRERLLTELARIPEVEAVTLMNDEPLGGMAFRKRYVGPLQNPDEPVMVTEIGIARDYFGTLRTPVLAGRSFNAGEDGRTLATIGNEIVLNQSAARMLLGERDPVGAVIRTKSMNPKEYRVIGVVGDTRAAGLRENAAPTAFRPISEQWFRGSFFIAVRSRVNEEQTQRAVQGVVKGLDPNIPFFRTSLMSENVENAMLRERLFARMATVLAGLAAVLAGIGLYGLLAYGVARRTREIGIRMALGASRRQIVADVTLEAMLFAVFGSVIGWFGGLAIARLLRSMFFGVTAFESWIYLATAALFLIIAAACSAMPARTAAGIQPASALRTE